jgi:hypothetical protein
MATVGKLIAKSRTDSTPKDPWESIRPHLLLLTGDQIYADDVADALLALCTDAGTTLLGLPDAGELLPAYRRPARSRPFRPGAAPIW